MVHSTDPPSTGKPNQTRRLVLSSLSNSHPNDSHHPFSSHPPSPHGITGITRDHTGLGGLRTVASALDRSRPPFRFVSAVSGDPASPRRSSAASLRWASKSPLPSAGAPPRRSRALGTARSAEREEDGAQEGAGKERNNATKVGRKCSVLSDHLR